MFLNDKESFAIVFKALFGFMISNGLLCLSISFIRINELVCSELGKFDDTEMAESIPYKQ